MTAQDLWLAGKAFGRRTFFNRKSNRDRLFRRVRIREVQQEWSVKRPALLLHFLSKAEWFWGQEMHGPKGKLP